MLTLEIEVNIPYVLPMQLMPTVLRATESCNLTSTIARANRKMAPTTSPASYLTV